MVGSVALVGVGSTAATSNEITHVTMAGKRLDGVQLGLDGSILDERPRALLVGDSTMLAIESYDAGRALRGFTPVLDVASCRTLGVPSCGPHPIPPNAVQAITSARGPFDAVVVMAGYDEWWTSFPASFDEVVTSARRQGAQKIIWLTYRENVDYRGPDGIDANEAFVRNNRTLREKISTGDYPDVHLADWNSYAAATVGWLHPDGIHLTPLGALGLADYISRQIAHTFRDDCPMPRRPSGDLGRPCPNPDDDPPVDVEALYP